MPLTLDESRPHIRPVTGAPADASSLDSIRRFLGDRYSLERELGRGGMGTVYLAREIKLDRPVALKVLSPEFASQAGLRDRFLRETRTAAGFSHPNIVPVYAVEESDHHLAYAMGLVEGETLTQRVERAGPLPTRELVRIVQDVGYALAYAHGRGVVHRDIKPDNVMLERATGRALVLDFGISRSMAQTAPASNLTRVGEVVGTPEYMSPEQASGDVVDGRSDLYALGLVAYFAATGQTAVTGDSTQKILVRQLTGAIPPIESLRPDLPPALSAAIDRCVRKDPAERFPTAEALVEEIDAAQLAEPEIPLPIRLFAGELSTLSLAVVGLVMVIWVVVKANRDANMSSLDTLLPAVGLAAILVARVLTTMGEARRLAESGFSVDEITGGLASVMAERVTRRAELRADDRLRGRRRSAVIWGAVLLVGSLAMVRVALSMRVRIGPTRYDTPPLGVLLVFGGFALFGVSLVLLVKSPFRMSPTERLFRIVWLGPAGRAFVWLSTRGVRTGAVTTRRVRHTPALSVTRPTVTPPAAAIAPPTPPPVVTLETLDARLREIERWRRTHDS